MDNENAANGHDEEDYDTSSTFTESSSEDDEPALILNPNFPTQSPLETFGRNCPPPNPEDLMRYCVYIPDPSGRRKEKEPRLPRHLRKLLAEQQEQDSDPEYEEPSSSKPRISPTQYHVIPSAPRPSSFRRSSPINPGVTFSTATTITFGNNYRELMRTSRPLLRHVNPSPVCGTHLQSPPPPSGNRNGLSPSSPTEFVNQVYSSDENWTPLPDSDIRQVFIRIRDKGDPWTTSDEEESDEAPSSDEKQWESSSLTSTDDDEPPPTFTTSSIIPLIMQL